MAGLAANHLHASWLERGVPHQHGGGSPVTLIANKPATANWIGVVVVMAFLIILCALMAFLCLPFIYHTVMKRKRRAWQSSLPLSSLAVHLMHLVTLSWARLSYCLPCGGGVHDPLNVLPYSTPVVLALYAKDTNPYPYKNPVAATPHPVLETADSASRQSCTQLQQLNGTKLPTNCTFLLTSVYNL